MNSSDIQHAADLLRKGNVVAIPTETVYGLAADAFNTHAVAKVFQIKNRPSFDPLIVHVSNLEQARTLAIDFPPLALKLAEKFWPGPLTLTLKKNPNVPDLVTSGLPTVAIRVPSHPVAQALLKEFNGPLAAPSANRFGRISPTTAHAVEKELGSAVSFILDGGSCQVGLESTIISFADSKPTLLRAGGIPIEKIEACIGSVTHAESAKDKPQAPGQLEHHYAPGKPLFLIEAKDLEKVQNPQATGLLAWGDLPLNKFKKVCNLSLKKNFMEAAANFFQMLRDLDESDVSEIVAIKLPATDLGLAINDRLNRASTKRTR
jgi:L-threonylcarbamoyladenylate synthase